MNSLTVVLVLSAKSDISDPKEISDRVIAVNPPSPAKVNADFIMDWTEEPNFFVWSRI